MAHPRFTLVIQKKEGSMMVVTVLGIKEFVQRIKGDKKFASLFKDAHTPEEVVALAEWEGYSFSVEEVINNTELTEEDLNISTEGGVLSGRDYSFIDW